MRSAFEGVLGPSSAANSFDEPARGNNLKVRIKKRAPEICLSGALVGRSR